MNLLRSEWLKLKKYPAFWLIMSLTALSYPGVNFIFQNIYKDAIQRKDQTSQLLQLILRAALEPQPFDLAIPMLPLSTRQKAMVSG